MIDSHCHLTWPDFAADLDGVLERAWNAGLEAIITIGAGQGMDGNRRAVAVAEQHDRIYAAVGLHPCDAKCFTPAIVPELEALATHPKVVAIGEIGLDYHYDHSNRTMQQEAFMQLLLLARRQQLPIIIHQREAEADLIEILDAVDTRNDKLLGVHHCFGGPLDFAHKMIDRGFYLGIGGVITFKNAEALRAVVKALPLDRLLLETDAPYLAPIPYRGKRNEPAYVALVAQTIATIIGEAPAVIVRQTTANAQRLFFTPPTRKPRQCST